MKRKATSHSAEGPPIEELRPRVLVVDDSAASRALVADLLESGGCAVVGRAMDGAMALRFVEETGPDVVVCDIEMPRMDGFTFLRIVSERSRTPTIVLTSFGSPEIALFALEYGARDFVVKATRPDEIGAMAQQLLARIRVLTIAARRARPSTPTPVDVLLPPGIELVAIGASTGGPPALRELVGRWGSPPQVPVVIAQHMPPRFTSAFAVRLARVTGLDVAEAVDGGLLSPGAVRVAPGGFNVLVERDPAGALRTRLVAPPAEQRSVPSVDALLASSAAACGAGALGVVLTGMGRDGEAGARELRRVGASMWIESPATATIEGMPSAAAQGHGAAALLPLDDLAHALSRLLGTARTRDDST